AILSALAWDIISLIVFRFLIGIGVGMDYPICAAYMAEMTPLADLITVIEKTIKDFRAHLVPADTQIISMLEQGIDLIEDALVKCHKGVNPIELKVDSYLNWITVLHSQLLNDSLQDESTFEIPEPPSFGQQVALFLSSDLDLLLDASNFLKGWVDGMQQEELERFKFELRVLSESAGEAGLSSMSELCDVLLDVCTYLENHESSLPKLLLSPFIDGFETLVEMMNQVASQQIPESPHTVFIALREALALLLNEQQKVIDSSEGKHLSIESAADITIKEIEATSTLEPVLSSIPALELDDYDNELRLNFIEEAFELLDESAHALESWLDNPDNVSPVHELQRNLHTLKGGARMAELYDLGNLCHALEDIYELVTIGHCPSNTIPIALIQKVHDALESSLTDLNSGKELVSTTHMLEELQALKKCLLSSNTVPKVDVLPDYLGPPESVQVLANSNIPKSVVGATECNEKVIAETAKPSTPALAVKATNQNNPSSEDLALQTTSSEMVRVPSDLLENLLNLAGESSISRSRIEQQISDTTRTLDEMNRTILRVREQLKRLNIETQTQIISHRQGDLSENPDYDPLEMDQYSELSQLSHALMESTSDLADLREVIQGKTKDMQDLLAQQSRTQMELQEKLMKARMVSFSRLIPRLRKIVRQVSDELGKPVELLIGDTEGEMDRTMLEKVLAPLEHMLRNAIGHGIENTIEDRQKLGKPDVGQISISIRRDGSDVVIELSDDGQGIDIEAVKAKAIEQHLVSKDIKLNDQEALELIMRSGFSTASSITHISGRGVGLDVLNSS
ncbi:MAG: Hpt domain-containing protein, partial [Endozoicomonas sp.]